MPSRDMRSGFTLVELLVATAILIILAGLSVGVISVALEGDRVPSTARQIQSYIEGARNEAIFAQEDRGVRFIRGEANDDEVVSMIYIGSAGESVGKTAILDPLTLMAPYTMGDFVLAQESGQDWAELRDRELLVPGSRINVGNGSNLWYQIHDDTFDTITFPMAYLDDPAGPRIKLARPYIGTAPDVDQDYTLELAPVPLPDRDPVVLPRGVVIDVDQSEFPPSWTANPNARFEFLFSPHGTVTGPAATNGIIHFLIADTRDTELGLPAGDSAKVGEELIVTLFTRTGLIETSPVDVTDVVAPLGTADDPFKYAETGASE